MISWVAIDKKLAETFREIRREFSKIEAMYSLSLDENCGKKRSLRAYSRMWGWSKGRVKRFIENAKNSEPAVNRQRTSSEPAFSLIILEKQTPLNQQQTSDEPAVNHEYKEKEQEQDKTPSASKKENAEKEDFYTSKKGRKLKNDKLIWFCHFWAAFDYKQGKAEAADSWLDIKKLDHNMAIIIYKAAQVEAKRRPGLRENGSTPKMAQGWLSGKRWEDEQSDNQKNESEWT